MNVDSNGEESISDDLNKVEPGSENGLKKECESEKSAYFLDDFDEEKSPEGEHGWGVVEQEAELDRLTEEASSSDVASVAPVASATRNTFATRVRTANECVTDAKDLPEMKPLFGTLWQKGQLTIFAGDTGLGKSILGVTIADSISAGKSISKILPNECDPHKIALYDFELSDRQFAKRFPSGGFSDKFLRIDMNPECIGCNFNFEAILADIGKTGAESLVIDNLSGLSLKTAVDAEVAINVMRSLKKLQAETGISILVLAHVPKIPQGIPLNVNHLAGSKQLSNLADSIFLIGLSRQGNDMRYLKQVKSRDAEMLEGVISCQIVKTEGMLSMNILGMDDERDHLPEFISQESTDRKEEARKLKGEGKSITEIAGLMGVNKSTVSRWFGSEKGGEVREAA